MADDVHVLYRFFNADGDLLYVGMTKNPGQRLAGHSSNQSWWREVANVTMEHCDTRAALKRAERDAIRNESPKYNVVHNKPTSGVRTIKFCGITIELDEVAGVITLHDTRWVMNGLADYMTFEPGPYEPGYPGESTALKFVPNGTEKRWSDEWEARGRGGMPRN